MPSGSMKRIAAFLCAALVVVLLSVPALAVSGYWVYWQGTTTEGAFFDYCMDLMGGFSGPISVDLTYFSNGVTEVSYNNFATLEVRTSDFVSVDFYHDGTYVFSIFYENYDNPIYLALSLIGPSADGGYLDDLEDYMGSEDYLFHDRDLIPSITPPIVPQEPLATMDYVYHNNNPCVRIRTAALDSMGFYNVRVMVGSYLFWDFPLNDRGYDSRTIYVSETPYNGTLAQTIVITYYDPAGIYPTYTTTFANVTNPAYYLAESESISANTAILMAAARSSSVQNIFLSVLTLVLPLALLAYILKR